MAEQGATQNEAKQPPRRAERALAILTGLESWLEAGSCRLQGFARCFLCSHSLRKVQMRGSLGSLSILPSRSTSPSPAAGRLPGTGRPPRAGGWRMEELQVVKAPLADAQWRRATRSHHEAGSRSRSPATGLVVGAFFFFFLVLVLRKTILTAPCSPLVSPLEQHRKCAWSARLKPDFHLVPHKSHVRLTLWGYFHTRGVFWEPLTLLKGRETLKKPHTEA